jgi:hypothetical protein
MLSVLARDRGASRLNIHLHRKPLPDLISMYYRVSTKWDKFNAIVNGRDTTMCLLP